MLAVAMLMPAVTYAQGNGGKKKKKTEQTTVGKPKPKPQPKPQPKPNNNSSGSSSNNDAIIRNLVSNMVYVEGGSFMMGYDDSDAMDDEKPVHREYVSSFRIGKYEVKQREWKAVMGNNPSRFKGDNLPVEKVSWDDCQQFIRKLNALTGKNFRLPTEAEWEYAARGGNLSRGYKYSGSNSIGSVAWYTENSGKKTHPVGTKSANELGLYDMSGNVWEWTSDNWCGDYNKSRTSQNLVSRGGGWLSTAGYCRVSNLRFERTIRYYDLGLRLAL